MVQSLKVMVTLVCLALFACSGSNNSSAEGTAPTNAQASSSLKTDSSAWLNFTAGILCILDDSQGNRWFGSHGDGVCRYDGSSFTYYTEVDGLINNNVTSIVEDHEGTIWFRTFDGVCSYNADSAETSEAIFSTPSVINFDSTHDWKLEDGDLWFSGQMGYGYTETEGRPGVYRYHDGEFTYLHFPLPDMEHLNAMYASTFSPVMGPNGTMWFGTYEASIGFDGNSFTIIDREKMGRMNDPLNVGIRAFYPDSKGNLWLGDNGSGVFMHNGDSTIHFNKVHKLRKEDTEGNHLDRMFAIGEDEDGNIWFGTTYSSGAWRYDPSAPFETCLTNYAVDEGIPCEHIGLIYKEANGDLLFGGSDPSGVYKLKDGNFYRIH